MPDVMKCGDANLGSRFTFTRSSCVVTSTGSRSASGFLKSFACPNVFGPPQKSKPPPDATKSEIHWTPSIGITCGSTSTRTIRL